MSSEALRPIGEEESMENGLQLRLVGDPERQLADATKACACLMRVVEDKHLYEEFGKAGKKKRHLLVEAWLFLGHMFGVTARLDSVIPVWDHTENHAGFEATVEAVHMGSGKIVGRATARCMSNEENWGEVAKYEYDGDNRTQNGTRQKAMQQLESMAQTRATSKVLSNVLRWVVVLGGTGVSGTPAEEMGGGKKKPEAQEQSTSAERISKAQMARMFAIGKTVGLYGDGILEIVKRHGFQSSYEVTRDKYAEIVKEIEDYGKPKEQAAP